MKPSPRPTDLGRADPLHHQTATAGRNRPSASRPNCHPCGAMLPTLVVGKMKAAKQLTATIEGFMDGQPVKVYLQVR